MQKNAFRFMLALILVLGFAVSSMAEPPDFGKPPSKEQMEKVRERIETLRMWKLTKALDLDEKTSSRIFPILNRYDKKRAEIQGSLMVGIKDLREALKDKREGQLKNIIDGIEHNHRTIQIINDEERTELKKVLTVEQQAKFIIFQQEFDHEIRKIIAETREKRSERLAKDRPERSPLPEKQ